MEHTFKKGDRVVLTDQVGRPTGTLVDATQTYNFAIKLDDGRKSEYDQSLWFTFARYVEHDRNFSVGDWVRYEKADSVEDAKMNGKVGVITKVSSNVYPCANVDGIASRLLQANLVKIAPPEEEQASETVTIEHDRWGRVEGVERDTLGAPWAKNGACYYPGDGWREVKPKRWVPVEIEISTDGRFLAALVNSKKLYVRHFILDKGYRWKTVEIEREVEG